MNLPDKLKARAFYDPNDILIEIDDKYAFFLPKELGNEIIKRWNAYEGEELNRRILRITQDIYNKISRIS